MILKLHLFAVAFWLGVVGVEFILERSRARSRPQGFAVADYHYRIDLGLEAPAFLAALITGLLLIESSRLEGWYLLKVLAGATAVIGNLACLWPVMRRKRAADRHDLDAVIRYSALLDRISLLAIPAGLLAFALGFSGVLGV